MFKSGDLAKFTKTLKKEINQIELNVVMALEGSLKLVEETSQSYVPIKTRDLRDSFFSRVERSNRKIVAIAGYDENGALSEYAEIMHEGFWPSNYANKNVAGQAINYHTTFQPTPRSHFLLLGFIENKSKINKLVEPIKLNW